jgi:HSP20 family molecular chaperone IbpA
MTKSLIRHPLTPSREMSRLINDFRAAPILDIFSPFTDLFDDMFSALPEVIKTHAAAAYPKVNIKDYPDKVIIEATITGLDKDDVKISKRENDDMTVTLAIKYKKEEEKCNENIKYLKKEISSSSFYRSWDINRESFNTNDIKITAENGLLSISIPKTKKDETCSKEWEEIKIE